MPLSRTDPYCVPQSDISGMDGQAWTKEGTSPIQRPTMSCHLFPSSQTDVDLLNSQIQASLRANLEHPLSQEWIPIPKGETMPPREIPWWPPNLDWFQAFPFQQFHVLFTLSSEYFSSFPHGTCSLSVSHPYLALDEIYHPFWAAIPNSPTLGKERFCWTVQKDHGRDSHPLWYLIPKNLYPSWLPSATLSWNYNSTRDVTPGRFQNWALPTSLAVTKGILVSFFSSAYLYA
jgi:hypothetical protein